MSRLPITITTWDYDRVRALEGNPSPAPQFLWPMLGEMTVPILVIRSSGSDMFAAERWTRCAPP